MNPNQRKFRKMDIEIFRYFLSNKLRFLVIKSTWRFFTYLKMATMKKMTIRRNKFLLLPESKKNRKLFLAINIYLIIGISSLSFTLFYLAGHLNNADSIIKYCYPGFALGISSAIIYFIGYLSSRSLVTHF